MEVRTNSLKLITTPRYVIQKTNKPKVIKLIGSSRVDGHVTMAMAPLMHPSYFTLITWDWL